MKIDARWIGELPDPMLRITMLWAYQTMLYAMSKRAADLGVNMLAQQQAAGDMAQRILRDMFERAKKEKASQRNTGDLVTRVARQVVEWTVDHVSE